MADTTATNLPSPNPDVVVLRIELSNDIIYALIGLILGPLGWWGALFMVWEPDFRAITADVRGSWLLALTIDNLGPVPLAIGFAVFGLWMTCLGVGGAWRLIDRRAAVTADRDGLHFHPSLCRSPVVWREVTKVITARRGPGQIRIVLARRFWSTFVWQTGHTIQLNNVALGLSSRKARETVNAMKALAPDQFKRPRGRSKPAAS